ncbi:hypothetical protein G7Y89_g1674 [Cudoniella acicularis]|uniref:Azaphilone pigments biosynthesis cluster protein L N-terminal domain-containing protein n=1 Tax=Cudoniella acicularis TaxID=354080 RepID=A0A8H4RUR9_9HELO|nr:hypothetical protein G7Y89_g1674 [Cudoniella acicularis]
MSFGYSVGDFIGLTQLVWKTVQNSRKACGEHGELTHEVKSLYLVLRRVEQEATKPNSLFNGMKDDDDTTKELKTAISGCHQILQILDQILEKYNALSDCARTGEKLWSKVRFGNGEMVDLDGLRAKMSTYMSGIVVFLNLLSMSSQGRVEQQMDRQGSELRQMRQSLNWITATLSSRSEGSVLSTHAGDDKAAWKELRRELIAEGYSSSIIMIHKNTIMDYVKELGDRGVLDEMVPLEEVPDTESIPAEASSAAISSPISNLPPEAKPMNSINDNRSEAPPKTRPFASYRTLDSFSVRIDGWELPRWICSDDGSVYFEVSTCYPCSICESRITSLHTAIRKNNRSLIENSEVEGGDYLQKKCFVYCH